VIEQSNVIPFKRPEKPAPSSAPVLTVTTAPDGITTLTFASGMTITADLTPKECRPCKGTGRIRGGRHGKGPEKVCGMCDGAGQW
jgi:hypothetical protein